MKQMKKNDVYGSVQIDMKEIEQNVKKIMKIDLLDI